MSDKFEKAGRETAELLLPSEKFNAIADFIKENSGLKCTEIQNKALAEVAGGKESLSGILNIEEEFSKDGRRLFIVTLDESHFPPNLLAGPGLALSGQGVAFICDGYSKAAHETIRAHELHHLNQEALPPGTSLFLRIPLEVVRELGTIWHSNIAKDPIGSAKVHVERLAKLHKEIGRYMEHVRKQIGIILKTLRD